MTTGQHATAAPGTIHLWGKPYTMSPLSDADIIELDNWLRGRVIADALLALRMTPDVTPDERKAVMGATIETAQGMTWVRGPGAERMKHNDGTAQVLWAGLHRHHPKLTPLDVASAIRNDPSELDEAAEVFKLINDTGGPADSDADPTTPPGPSPTGV